MSTAELKLRPGERIVRLDVVAASASSGQEAEEEKASVELVPSTAPAPLHLVRRSRVSTVGDWSPEALQIWAGGLPVCLGRHLPGTVGSVPYQEHHLRHPLLPVRCVAPFGHRPVNILQVGQGAKRNSSA